VALRELARFWSSRTTDWDAKPGNLEREWGMSQLAAGIHNVNPVRTKALVIPREHGAWGLLLIPLVTGACVGFVQHGRGLGDLVLFLTAALALFWVRTPFEILVGSSVMRAHTDQEKRIVWQSVLALGVCAVVPLYALLREGRHTGLLFIAAISGAAFATQACVKLFGREMRMPAQIIGAIGLTSTSAGAYYILTGRLDSLAMALWMANWVFAGDQIHFVHVRLHGAKLEGIRNRIHRSWVFLVGQLAMLCAVALIGVSGVLPAFAVLAFVPVTLRGMIWIFGRKAVLDLQWLGITELLHSITFGVLLITSFYIPR
jgi:hypothetical protein